MMKGYLRTGKKEECLGCEACVQVCHRQALTMVEDEEGFRYPKLDVSQCVFCGACNLACPIEHEPEKHQEEQTAYGGYLKDRKLKEDSTSGGAFSAIVEAWCDTDYVIFGAEADRLEVRHTYITDKKELGKYRKSKYAQSHIGSSYKDVRRFLREGKKVLFSGTPCHIAGLRSFLRRTDTSRLLTVEVVCEGVPSPHYVRKYDAWMTATHGSAIASLDYRYKDGRKWDFQVMRTELDNRRSFIKDRWFNPFWSIWLQHLMSRPSCYHCPYATSRRGADITLGDLWGVHLYCPELYGRNGGASLVVCNSGKGREVLDRARTLLYGHDLPLASALRYQSPMRQTIGGNPRREECIADLRDPAMNYEQICEKWAVKPSFKLLWQKYVWGNRQKVFFWNLKHYFQKDSKC